MILSASEELRSRADPDRRALHVRLEQFVGDLAQIFDGGKDGNHWSAPCFDLLLQLSPSRYSGL